MQPKLGQGAVPNVPHVDAGKLHDDAVALRRRLDERDHMLVRGGDVVDGRPERSSRERRNLGEVPAHLVAAAILPGDPRAARDAEYEVV
jgi:hypothetical protein